MLRCQLSSVPNYRLAQNWIIAGMKEGIVNRGPLIASVALYSDFKVYAGGVYRTTNDPFDSNPSVDYLTGHSVCLNLNPVSTDL